MSLLSNLTDGSDEPTTHAEQHNLLNAAILALPIQILSASPYVTPTTPNGAGFLGIDTTNGALWFAYGTSSTDWVRIGGVVPRTDPMGPGVIHSDGGFNFSPGSVGVICGHSFNQILISDLTAYSETGGTLTGSQAGLQYKTGAGDGDQTVTLTLYDGTSTYYHFWAADGSYTPSTYIYFNPGYGPVVQDSTDGHSYRIGTTNGTLTLTEVSE